MKMSSLKDAAVKFALAALLTVGATAMVAAPASAATPEAPAASETLTDLRPASSSYLAPGATGTFPTWFWGTTKLCVTNYGPGDNWIRIQTIFGADPEWLYVPVGTTQCVARWWGAVPINVYNPGPSPVQATTY